MFGQQDDTSQPQSDNGYLGGTAPAVDTTGWSTESAPSDTNADNSSPEPTQLLEPEAHDGHVDNSAPSSTPLDNNGLLDIKQQALQQLSPLVNHLEQSPEEKFHTTMMMIQASDNQDLLKGAFEAAQQITDDKARAQALLDVINEINYFTQHPAQ